MPMCEQACGEGMALALNAENVAEEIASPAALAAEILRKAAYRVGQPGAWTQHYLGRLEDGTGTFARRAVHEDSVRSRCLLGALYCEHDLDPRANIHAAYEAIVRAIGTSLVADWNDDPARRQEEVVGALLEAAEIAANGAAGSARARYLAEAA